MGREEPIYEAPGVLPTINVGILLCYSKYSSTAAVVRVSSTLDESVLY